MVPIVISTPSNQILNACLAVQMKVPLSVIGGHNKAVSYVRFMGGERLVSASTDNKLKLWDVDQATATGGKCDALMTYTGEELLKYPKTLSSRN